MAPSSDALAPGANHGASPPIRQPGFGTPPDDPRPPGAQPVPQRPRRATWVLPVVVVVAILVVGGGILLVGILGGESSQESDTAGAPIETERDLETDVRSVPDKLPGGSSSALPSLSISGPPSGALLEAGLVTVSASVRSGVDRYRLEVDGAVVVESSGPDLEWRADPGRHSLVMVAEAPDGSLLRSDSIEVTVEVSDAAPVDGEWIVSLGSYPGDHPQEGLASALDDLRPIAPDVTMMRTDGWPSLTPDYWVLYVGPFDSAAETWDACHEMGLRNSSACFGAPISNDPDDRSVRVYPQAERP